MSRLFIDPTPRIERNDSLCTVVSVGAESTTHTGKTGVVSWKGRNYGCTIIGSVAAGDKAHFIQTKDGHVWAIKSGSYYRSAYPKRPEEWVKKAPASLAILELMRKNPRDRVFQTGKIKAIGTNTATVNLRGKDVLLPTKFEGVLKQTPQSKDGKLGLVFKHELVTHGPSVSLSFAVSRRLHEVYEGHSSLISYGPPSSSAVYMAAVYAYMDEMAVSFPVEALVQRMTSAGFTGFSIVSFTQTSVSSTSISYNQQGSPPPSPDEYTSFTRTAYFNVSAYCELEGSMPSLYFDDIVYLGPF